MNLYQVAEEIARRLASIFLRDEQGRRPVYGGTAKFQEDPHWRDLPPVLRVLPRRQRGRPRREPPDRLDRRHRPGHASVRDHARRASSRSSARRRPRSRRWSRRRRGQSREPASVAVRRLYMRNVGLPRDATPACRVTDLSRDPRPGRTAGRQSLHARLMTDTACHRHSRRASRLLVLAPVAARVALRDAFDRGGIYLFSRAFLEDIPERLTGPRSLPLRPATV